jgi:GNAT superfamily N-acetyltransferase
MPADPVLLLTDEPDASARQAILDPLIRFNRASSGIGEDYRRLAVLIQDSAAETVIGGLWGATYYRRLFIELLYVPEALRGTGTGRRLMGMAEVEAERRGCLGVWLDTYSFQARGFYERLGYSVFGTMEDFPPGHSRFFLSKTLPVPPSR